MSVRHQNTLKYLILLDLTFCMLLLHEWILFTFKYTGTTEETGLIFQKHQTLSTLWLKTRHRIKESNKMHFVHTNEVKR